MDQFLLWVVALYLVVAAGMLSLMFGYATLLRSPFDWIEAGRTALQWPLIAWRAFRKS